MNDMITPNGPIDALEVNINDVGKGGAWSFIKNAMQSPSEKRVIFNFFSLEPFEDEADIQFVKKHGGYIYVRYTKNRYFRQIKTFFELRRLLKEKKFDIVHIHSDLAFKILIEALAARSAGSSVIICHSHCTEVDGDHRIIKKIAHLLSRPVLGKLGTAFFACSKKAGEWMYTKKICNTKLKIINNAIDCQAFAYNEEIRIKYRHGFKIAEDEILIGHVGRFMYQKNHEFLIDIFYNLHLLDPKTKLLLIGEGELETLIRKKVKELHLENSVIFAGVRNDVNFCMQAMDLFLLPSRFEGLPVVGIEAQAAGLPCLMSDTITKETDLFGLVEFMSLEMPPNIWAQKAKEMVAIKRKNTYKQMAECGYDIHCSDLNLKDTYAKILLDASGL